MGIEESVDVRHEVDAGFRPPECTSAAAPTTPHTEHVRHIMRHTQASQRLMRAEARAFLAEAMVTGRRVDDVVLVLTELVTNGCEAAGTAAPVSTILSVDGMITIEVINGHRADSPDVMFQDTLTMPNSDATRGRGLALVAALAARLSIETTPLFTSVRAEILP